MRALPLASLAVLVAFAGCSDDGGGDATDTPTPTTGGPGIAPMPDAVDLTVAAVGAYPINPAFDPADLQVPAGALVNVTFRNEDSIPLVDHNWVVEGIEGASVGSIAPGEEATASFTAPAEAGEYAFYCSIGDHRDRGMEGTLSVVVA